MENDKIKFCKDCAHVRGEGEVDATCDHPDAGRVSLVTGMRNMFTAAKERDVGGACGPAGHLWEPAPAMATTGHVPGR